MSKQWYLLSHKDGRKYLITPSLTMYFFKDGNKIRSWCKGDLSVIPGGYTLEELKKIAERGDYKLKKTTLTLQITESFEDFL